MANVNGMTFRNGKPKSVTITLTKEEALALTLILGGRSEDDDLSMRLPPGVSKVVYDELTKMVWNSHYYDGLEEARKDI